MPVAHTLGPPYVLGTQFPRDTGVVRGEAPRGEPVPPNGSRDPSFRSMCVMDVYHISCCCYPCCGWYAVLARMHFT